MINLLSGILASSVHVVSGPDHLAAITPLAIDSQKKSWLIGLMWGIGHTSGVIIIGLLFLFFRNLIPVEKISLYSEQIVGIVLIIIGILAIVRVNKISKKQNNSSNKKNVTTAIAVGVIHGLAGVSHLIGIIPSLSLPTKFEAALYLSGFAIGTILAMVVYSTLLGIWAKTYAEKNKDRMLKILKLTGGFLAIAVGLFWL